MVGKIKIRTGIRGYFHFNISKQKITLFECQGIFHDFAK